MEIVGDIEKMEVGGLYSLESLQRPVGGLYDPDY